MCSIKEPYDYERECYVGSWKSLEVVVVIVSIWFDSIINIIAVTDKVRSLQSKYMHTLGFMVLV
jgi:cellulose synthase/poly-beta-1,6-N-acetylglucosamine synthase-like glycosyltransferase